MRNLAALLAATVMFAACGEQKKPETKEGSLPVATAGTDHGKILFQGNCQQCHAVNQDKTGPMLQGVLGRWGNDTAHLVAFVKNSQQVIAAEGDNSYAGKLYAKWYKTAMPANTHLSDAEIKEIVTYVNKGVE